MVQQMKTMQMSSDMTKRLTECPPNAQAALQELLAFIQELAIEEGVDLACGLKWNEPSFWTKQGSPFRIYWDDFGNLSLMFHCQTKLIETFRIVFPNWTYEGNRALRLEKIPLENLRPVFHCAFHYKSLRQEPLLGLADPGKN